MTNPFYLSHELGQLRKNFHLSLSNKRRLMIKETDYTKVAGLNDMAVQARFEKISFYRSIFFFWRLLRRKKA